MHLEITVEALLEVQEETPALLQVEALPQPGYQTLLKGELQLDPPSVKPPESFRDIYGNACQRVLFAPGETRLSYKARVEQPDAQPRIPVSGRAAGVMALPEETLHFLLPSRYCPSDRMLKISSDLFAPGGTAHSGEPGFPQVLSICQWINRSITYGYGTSNASTSAIDTFVDRRGVCRDFSHLAIAFCRALNIPARYVSGYCLGLDPPDMHAFFQAFVEDRWVSFDATALEVRPALVEVALGRDAGDCAWCTFYGNGQTKKLDVAIEQSSNSA